MAEFLRRKLSNGMIVLMEKRETPVITLGIANPIGAGFEDSKIKGVFHVIEHMVFTGTQTRTHEDISKEIEKRGGILNAFTSNEATCFWFKLPSEHVFIGLEILSDLLLNPKFDKLKFEKEKKVILEEIKMYHDDPERDVQDQIFENLYEKPFGERIIGSKTSVLQLERDFVYSFFKKHYTTSNFIVSIVGKGDFNKICEFLEKKFGNQNKESFKVKPIIFKNKETIEERKGIDQAHFVFGVHAPLISDKEYSALEVLDTYLANGMSSKLFLKIREEKGLAYSVQSSINSEKSYSYYTIYAGTLKEAVSEVKKIILDELDKVENISEKELNEAKERVIGLRKVVSEESSRVMPEILFYELASKAEEYYTHEQKINNVTSEQVKNLARNMKKNYSTASIVPN